MSTELEFHLNDRQLSYGEHPVLQIDELKIAAGEKVALLGISGSGKSTLLDFLHRQSERSVAYCPQQLGLVPILSVFHNIYIGRLAEHANWFNLLNLIKAQPEPLASIREICAQIGMEEKLFNSVDQLSGGQQQRTALGRAFYRGADIFIGDEPVSAVDDLQAAQLIEQINHRHRTTLVALHDRDLALNHFQRIIGLHQGRVLIDAPAKDLSPEHLTPLYTG